MARVDRLQKRRGFRAANFAEKQAIGTKTKTGFEQVLYGNLCKPLPAFRRQQGEPIGLRRLQLARILDRHDALAIGNLFEKRVEKGRLSRRRSARNNHRDVIFHRKRQGSLHAFGGGVLQQRRQLRFDFRVMVEIGLGGTAYFHAFESAHARVVAQIEIGDDLLSDGKCAAARGGRRKHALKSLAVRHGGRKQRRRGVDRLRGGRGDMLRKPPDSRCRQLFDLEPLHCRLAEGFDPNFSRPVDADFDDVRVL